MPRPIREDLEHSGYEYIRHAPELGGHILRDSDGNLELWVANKNHASYAIVYKNTHLEFVRSV
jgi:hypothetical protein